MKPRALAAAFVSACLLAAPRVSAATDATLFRVFLSDGTVLVSYGEFARVGDRIVFSMPTSAAVDNSPLHLVNLAADRVDWERTNRYAEAARASHYVSTRAEADYAAVSDRVAQTLSEVAHTSDATARLTIVERARKVLADWPHEHYFYRAAEVRQMLSLLDEAIADLRAAGGGQRFALNLVAWTDPPTFEPMLPEPTPREAIEQVFLAARAVDSSAERLSLLHAGLAALDHDAAVLPADWAARMRAASENAIAEELETDRAYRALTEYTMAEAGRRAGLADVRGVERLLGQVRQRDAEMGSRRPDAVTALVSAVEERLDAARRLRLALDRWALRGPVLRRYRRSMTAPLALFARLSPSLEDIKALAGSAPGSLRALERSVARIKKRMAAIHPPDEMRAAHGLLASALELAGGAARIRYDATVSGSMPRAWDASSAAAGALMLVARAKGDIQSALHPPLLR